MNRKRWIAILTVMVICLIGWAAHLVFGQQESDPRPEPFVSPPAAFPPGPGIGASDKEGSSPLGTGPTTPLPSSPIAAGPPSALTEKRGSSEPKQMPAVTVEWIGPATARLGQPVTCVILVKNTAAVPATGVEVRAPLPSGIIVQSTEPKARTITDQADTPDDKKSDLTRDAADPSMSPVFGKKAGAMLLWEIGILAPQQEKRLEMKLVPESKGDLACKAFVTFTGSAVARMQVRDPKLSIKASGPEKTQLGDTAIVNLTVANPGDGTAEHVKVRVTLPGVGDRTPRTAEFNLNDLAANESRPLQLKIATKAEGQQKCEVVAVADGNLMAKETVTLNVFQPRLDLSLTGPKLRYVDRQAVYILKVSNPCSSAMSNVVLTQQIPPGFKFVEASADGKHDAANRTVSWALGDMAPNQSKEVNVKVVAAAPGEFKHKAIVSAARCNKTEAETITRVEGLATLTMEVVCLDNPVEVGMDTAYEIRVTNTGTKTETNLQLSCTIPDNMELRGVQGANGVKHRIEGKEIIFDDLPKLAPRADVTYRVNFRGQVPGDLRFQARIKADSLQEPLLKQENTKVYGDENVPDIKGTGSL